MIDIALDRPVCTITFDDVPRSALANGIPILNNAGVPATFYLAGGFSRSPNYVTLEDVPEMLRQGHDIQCHTFRHSSPRRGGVANYVQDAGRNRDFFRTELGLGLEHFAYPFGEVTLRAKRRLAPAYRSLRSIYPGVNGAGTDLALLRGNPIFSATVNWSEVKALVREGALCGGWLIFYTHGVERRPNRWGCTEEDLSRLVEICRADGYRFASIKDAYQMVVE